MKKRLLSLLLCLCMVMSLLPTTVFAAEPTGYQALLKQLAGAEHYEQIKDSISDGYYANTSGRWFNDGQKNTIRNDQAFLYRDDGAKFAYFLGRHFTFVIEASDKARLFQITADPNGKAQPYLQVATEEPKTYTPQSWRNGVSANNAYGDIFGTGSYLDGSDGKKGTMSFFLKPNQKYVIFAGFTNYAPEGVDGKPNHALTENLVSYLSDLKLTEVAPSTITYQVKDGVGGKLIRHNATEVKTDTTITDSAQVDYMKESTLGVDVVPNKGYHFVRWEWTAREGATTSTQGTNFKATNWNYTFDSGKTHTVTAVFEKGQDDINKYVYNATDSYPYEPQWYTTGESGTVNYGEWSMEKGQPIGTKNTLETKLLIAEDTIFRIDMKGHGPSGGNLRLFVDDKPITLYYGNRYIDTTDSIYTGNNTHSAMSDVLKPGLHTVRFEMEQTWVGGGPSAYSGSLRPTNMKLESVNGKTNSITVNRVNEEGKTITAGTVTAAVDEVAVSPGVKKELTNKFHKVTATATGSDGAVFSHWTLNGTKISTSTTVNTYIADIGKAHELRAVFLLASDSSSKHFKYTQKAAGTEGNSYKNPYDGIVFDQAVCNINKNAPLLWNPSLFDPEYGDTRETTFEIISSEAVLTFDYYSEPLQMSGSDRNVCWITIDKVTENGSETVYRGTLEKRKKGASFAFKFPSAGKYRMHTEGESRDGRNVLTIENLRICNNPMQTVPVEAKYLGNEVDASFLEALRAEDGAKLDDISASLGTTQPMVAPGIVTYDGTLLTFDHWEDDRGIVIAKTAVLAYRVVRNSTSAKLIAVYKAGGNINELNKAFIADSDFNPITFSNLVGDVVDSKVQFNSKEARVFMSDQMIVSDQVVWVEITTSALHNTERNLQAIDAQGNILVSKELSWFSSAKTFLTVPGGTPFYVRISLGAYDSDNTAKISNLKLKKIPTYTVQKFTLKDNKKIEYASDAPYEVTGDMYAYLNKAKDNTLVVKKLGDTTNKEYSNQNDADAGEFPPSISITGYALETVDGTIGTNKSAHVSGIGTYSESSSAVPTHAFQFDPKIPIESWIDIVPKKASYFSASDIKPYPYTGTNTIEIPAGIYPLWGKLDEKHDVSLQVTSPVTGTLFRKNGDKYEPYNGTYVVHPGEKPDPAKVATEVRFQNTTGMMLTGTDAGKYSLDRILGVYTSDLYQTPKKITANDISDADIAEIKKLINPREYDNTSIMNLGEVPYSVKTAADLTLTEGWVTVKSAELCDQNGKLITFAEDGNYSVKITFQTAQNSPVYFGGDDSIILSDFTKLVTPHEIKGDEIFTVTEEREYTGGSRDFANVTANFAPLGEQIKFTGVTATVASENAGTYHAATLSKLTLPNGFDGKFTLPMGGTIEIDSPLVSLTIKGIPIKDFDYTLSPNSFVYDGTAKNPTVTVTTTDNPAVKLELSKDYTVEYRNNTAAEEATAETHPTVIVKGIGQYEGTKEIPFTIEKGESTLGTPVVKNGETATTDFVYGDTITVEFTPGVAIDTLDFTTETTNQAALYLGTTQLTTPVTADENGKFKLTYDTAGKGLAISDTNEVTVKYGGDSNLNAGSATITIKLTAKPLTLTGLTGVTRQYNKDDLTVTLSGGALDGLCTVDTNAVSFDVTNITATMANAAVGTAKTLTLSGDCLSGDAMGYYAFTYPTNVTVEIKPQVLTNGVPKGVTIESIADQTFTGAALEPAVTVKDGTVELNNPTDYTVEYSNNIKGATGTVTVTFDGNYSGTMTTTFVISSEDSTTETEPDKTEAYTYGETLTLTANVAIDTTANLTPLAAPDMDKVKFFCGTNLLGEAEVKYSANNATGTAVLEYDTAKKGLAIGENKITAKFGGSVNLNNSDSSEITVMLEKKQLTGTIAAGSTKTYDGNVNFENVTVMLTNLESDTAEDAVAAKANFTVASKDAGTAQIAISPVVTLDGDDLGYYLAPTTLGGTVEITKADAPTAVANTKTARFNATTEQTHTLTGMPEDMGTVTSYTVGDITGDIVFSGNVICENGILSFTLTGDGTINQTATVPVTIVCQNYEDVVVNVTVTLIEKIHVEDKITFADGTLTYTGAALSYENATIKDFDSNAITYTYEVADGGALQNGKPLTAGTYTVTAAYEDEKNFGQKSATLTVEKAAADTGLSVDAENKTYTYGESITFTATPVAEEMQSFGEAAETVEFFYDEVSLGKATVGADGTATLSYATTDKLLPIGENLAIKAVYSGNHDLNAKTDTITGIKLNALPLTGTVAEGITKVYDGTALFTDISVTLAGVLGEDSVTTDITASFDAVDKNVGDAKGIKNVVATLSGDDAKWYAAPTALTGTVAITAKEITVASVAVDSKIYDGEATATIKEIIFKDLVDGETLTYNVDVTATAAFADVNAGSEKQVDITAITLNSTKAQNYSIVGDIPAVTSSITAAEFTGTVTISSGNGTLTADDTLTATVVGGDTLTYQWKNDGKDINGAINDTYTLTAEDTGKITCTVTSSGNVVGEKTSNTLEIGKTPLTGSITITGNTTLDSELVFTVSEPDLPEAENYDILWSDGSTEETYTVKATDLGKTVTVTITGKGDYTGTLTATKEIPATVPTAPVITATAGDSKVTISWTAPFNGGSAITGYKLTVDGTEEIPVAPGATSHEVTNLTNGTEYTFTLVATNGVGDSAVSNTETVTPVGMRTITFDTMGGRAIAPIEVKTGYDMSAITLPTPHRSGYNFVGWYLDSALTTAFDKTALVSVDFTLYAKWTVQESSGIVDNKPTISFNEGGTALADSDGNVTITPDKGYKIGKITINGEEVTIPANGKLTGLSSKHKVIITFEKIPTTPVNERFTDVPATAWFTDEVQFVVDNGMFDGTSKTTFSPNAFMTRAMFWTVLYRHSGADTKGEGTQWYSDAEAWVKENGISDGSKHDGEISREQIVTILYRYTKGTAAKADMSKFTDADEISDFASEAMNWAVEQGLLQGDGGKLNPKKNATRAEVAAILMRYCEKTEK